MFNFFARKPAPVATTAAPEFIEVRSRYGVAFHIVPNNAGEGEVLPALCGYTSWVFANDPQLPADKTAILAALPNQHAGFSYCSDCVMKFTGISAETLLWKSLKH